MDEALDVLRALPFTDLDFAKLDSHRTLRGGFPEVVFCMGKRVEHIVTIMERLTAGPGPAVKGYMMDAMCSTSLTMQKTNSGKTPPSVR